MKNDATRENAGISHLATVVGSYLDISIRRYKRLRSRYSNDPKDLLRSQLILDWLLKKLYVYVGPFIPISAKLAMWLR